TELGEIVYSEPMVWAGLEGGVAAQRSPLPLALASHGCPWRGMALAALDHAGLPYRVAYSCESCSGQEAALQADLAVAPLPQGLVRPPLRRLDNDPRLPPLGNSQVMMVCRPGSGTVTETLAEHVKAAFRALR
ncbi:MAG: LysR substrate-binding domain-containing protein, partial [Halomonas sp.]|nr:LysR substrate-binding domain-containing protein [Halomonas sp.]